MRGHFALAATAVLIRRICGPAAIAYFEIRGNGERNIGSVGNSCAKSGAIVSSVARVYAENIAWLTSLISCISIALYILRKCLSATSEIMCNIVCHKQNKRALWKS